MTRIGKWGVLCKAGGLKRSSGANEELQCPSRNKPHRTKFPDGAAKVARGLRLFESALRRKLGQLSVLEFEYPSAQRDDSID
jgi:hypothetical protein